MSKTVLIIGAGPGIGLATARRFAREGYHIVMASRNLGRLQTLVSKLNAEGFSASGEQVDASDPHDVARLVLGVGEELQVLHYNSGVLHYDAQGILQARPLEAESIDSLVTDTQINVVGALAAIHAALPLLSNKPGASVLLTGGGFGVDPSGDFLTLSVGKAALRAVALGLFQPLQSRGIHIATVTVSRLVSPGSNQAVEVADALWGLHSQPLGQWTAETLYR